MSLSDKIHDSLSEEVPDGFIFESDVKEFIRALKAQFDHKASQRKGEGIRLEIIDMVIDKLAGDKLI